MRTISVNSFPDLQALRNSSSASFLDELYSDTFSGSRRLFGSFVSPPHVNDAKVSSFFCLSNFPSAFLSFLMPPSFLPLSSSHFPLPSSLLPSSYFPFTYLFHPLFFFSVSLISRADSFKFLWHLGHTGEGIRVGIFDTGLNVGQVTFSLSSLLFVSLPLPLPLSIPLSISPVCLRFPQLLSHFLSFLSSTSHPSHS